MWIFCPNVLCGHRIIRIFCIIVLISERLKTIVFVRINARDQNIIYKLKQSVADTPIDPLKPRSVLETWTVELLNLSTDFLLNCVRNWDSTVLYNPYYEQIPNTLIHKAQNFFFFLSKYCRQRKLCFDTENILKYAQNLKHGKIM